MLFGALAPALLPNMTPLMAASLGAGLGGAVQSGDLETGLLTGLGAFAGGSLLGPMLGGAGGAAGSAGAAGAAGAKAASGATAAQAARAAATAPAAASGANLAQAQAAGLPALAAAAPPVRPEMLGAAKPGMFRGAMDFMKSGTGMGVGIGSMAGPALGEMFDLGGKDKKTAYNGSSAKEMRAMPQNVQTPGAGYRPGIDAEFNYGVGGVPTAGQVLDFRDTGALRYSDGGLLRRYQKMMGPVKMAEGGIATLAETDEGMAAPAPVGGNEKEVIAEAVRAIKGQSQNAEVALGAFLSMFGEQALRDLVDRVQSGEFDQNMQSSTGKMTGPGDGMSDMIPASIGGEQDVLLSDGEFVVPADVVSGLGNGSTDAGARQLEEMGARVRQSRTGTAAQPSPLPPDAVMPA